jgi:Xaa-Pro aminopeptidase
MSESLRSNSRSDGFPSVLPLRDRASVVDKITRMRLDRLLGQFMEETGFDMWIILCNEDNYDPVFLTMTPYESWCPITQILVFYQPEPGEDVQRLNISRTNMQGLHETVWDPNKSEEEKETQWECLKRIIAERRPKRIAINESDVIWAAGGLTVSLKKKLIETIGPEYASRLHSAEKLATLWLETLLDEELDLYERAAAINHALIAETFSSQVITPEVTTTDDLCWHYRQRATMLGLQKSFMPFFRIRARDPEVLKTYPIEDKIIRRGDVLHCDVGIIYLRYYTDMQEMAYVLKRGETEVPEGFKIGMAECNELQDIFCKGLKEGLTGNQMLGNMLQEARAKGLKEPKIYSHSLGYYLHEPGPLIGLPWEQENTGPWGEVQLVANSCSTVELSVTHPIPEWGGQPVCIGLEQMVAFTSKGTHILDGRQREFHIIS